MFLTGLARVARDAGLSAREVAGWKTRTAHKGGMNKVHGVIWHHTATPAASVVGRNNPTTQYMTNGLGYPLANYGLAWDGSLDVIAAGTGAHAGKGSYKGIPNNDGNRHLIGVEVEGTIGLTWSAAQLETAARLGAALDREFGQPLLHIGHYEWAPGRKTDPTGIPGNMPALRTAIKRGYWTPPVVISPAASITTPATPKETFTVSDIKAITDKLDRLEKLISESDRNNQGRTNAIPAAVWGHVLPHPRHEGVTSTTGAYLASDYANGQAIHAMTKAIAEKTGIDPAEIEAIIRDAIEKGLAGGVEVEASINVKGK